MYFEEALNELLASGHDGKVKDNMGNCWLVYNGRISRGNCAGISGSDWTVIQDEQATPTPPQETELLTGWEAIKLAIKNDGEIWNEIRKEFRIRVENGEITKGNANVLEMQEYIYAVRPLTFDFNEAMERMDSGKRVADEEGNEYSVALVKNTFGGSCQFTYENELKDKRFTSVPE